MLIEREIPLYTLYIYTRARVRSFLGRMKGNGKPAAGRLDGSGRALGWLWQRARMGVARGCGSVPGADRANVQMVLLHQFHP